MVQEKFGVERGHKLGQKFPFKKKGTCPTHHGDELGDVIRSRQNWSERAGGERVCFVLLRLDPLIRVRCEDDDCITDDSTSKKKLSLVLAGTCENYST